MPVSAGHALKSDLRAVERPCRTNTFRGMMRKAEKSFAPNGFTYRSKHLVPGAGSPFHAKAILEPSAEKAGEVSSPGRAVNGTAVKAAWSFGRCSRCHRWATTAARATAKMTRTPAPIFNQVRRECEPRSDSTVATGSTAGPTTSSTGGSNSPINRYPAAAASRQSAESRPSHPALRESCRWRY
jgi:hypothetical protein